MYVWSPSKGPCHVDTVLRVAEQRSSQRVKTEARLAWSIFLTLRPFDCKSQARGGNRTLKRFLWHCQLVSLLWLYMTVMGEPVTQVHLSLDISDCEKVLLYSQLGTHKQPSSPRGSIKEDWFLFPWQYFMHFKGVILNFPCITRGSPQKQNQWDIYIYMEIYYKNWLVWLRRLRSSMSCHLQSVEPGKLVV